MYGVSFTTLKTILFNILILFAKKLCSVCDLHICITWRRSLRNGSASLAKSRFLRPHPQLASSEVGRQSYNVTAWLFAAISKYLSPRENKTEANQEVRNRHLTFQPRSDDFAIIDFALREWDCQYFAGER